MTRHLVFLGRLVAIIAGVILGVLAPDVAISLKPLGDGFIALIRMLTQSSDLLHSGFGNFGRWRYEKVGRIGGKALLYFEAGLDL